MPATPAADPTPDRFSAPPGAALRSLIVEYWGMERDLAAMGGFTVTPDRHGELVCCADDLYAVRAGVRTRLPGVFLVGLLGGPLRLESDGPVRCAGARLEPWALGAFGGLVGAGAGPGLADGSAVFGRGLGPVLEALRRRDWPTLAGEFDRALRAFLPRSSPSASAMAGAFTGGLAASTAEAAEAAGLSRRSVERSVHAATRCSPKQLACLSRFQTVRDAVWADPAADLARLAVAAGYADQSHMTRHFRRYSGVTPARFARDAAARKTASRVAFVQSRGREGV